MKRTLLSGIAILLVAVCASAKSLVLELNDGTLVYYLLGGETNPVLRFDGDEVMVDADKYAFTDVAKFFISEEDQPTAIDGKPAEAQTEMKDGQLYVSTQETVAVYTTDGRLVSRAHQAGKGRSVVDASQLAAGVYVVRYGKKSFKFVKR
jgi:hypothetical protein